MGGFLRLWGWDRGRPPIEAGATAADDAMMARALGLARTAADAGEVPVGAIVYRLNEGGVEILGAGMNTREAAGDPAGHAEMAAIRAACGAVGDWRLEGCTLVVTLEPCPMCAGAIVNARVPRVVFGARDPKAGAVRSLYELLGDARLNHRATVIEGVRGEECARELREFFRTLRARKRAARLRSADERGEASPG